MLLLRLIVFQSWDCGFSGGRRDTRGNGGEEDTADALIQARKSESCRGVSRRWFRCGF
jgi:hypothetical protein